jgi:hypothetical protein
MAQKIDINEIARNNPQVSLEQLRKGRRLLKQLRQLGVRKVRYRLAPASAGRRVHVVENSEAKIITLRQN